MIDPEVRVPATLLYQLIDATRNTAAACVGGLSVEPGQESHMGWHFDALANEAMSILRRWHPKWLAQHDMAQEDEEE